MDDQDLGRELERTRTALAECAGQGQGLVVLLQTKDLHMLAAWLLLALGQYDDAITAAHAANRARYAAWVMNGSPYGGAVLWESCEARSAAHLARGQWREAEQAAHEALMDFEEDEGNLRVYRIARQAQGKPQRDPDRASRDLAEFDARDYALMRIRARWPHVLGSADS